MTGHPIIDIFNHIYSVIKEVFLATYGAPSGDYKSIIIGISLGFIVPMCIFTARNNILSIRKGIVKDLEALFDFAVINEKKIIIPSFELVKYKYDASDNSEFSKTNSVHRSLHKWQSYMLPLMLFFLISSSGISYTLDLLYNFDNISSNFISYPSFSCLKLFTMGSFLGGYVWSVIYLSRRVSNFDLAPISFFRATLHILMGVIVAGMVYIFLGQDTIKNNPQIFPISFLIGLFPKIGIDIFIAKFPAFRLKRLTSSTKDLFEEVPLDCISGIDPMMKYRLSEYEIEEVQNLATANPIQLFVETPYGLYEVIDWIAQAQLIVAVGTERYAKLKSLGIRTLFDLEKLPFTKAFREPLIDIFFDDLLKKNSKSGDLNNSKMEDYFKFEIDNYTKAKSNYFEKISNQISDPNGSIDPSICNPSNPQWIIGSEVFLDTNDPLHALIISFRDELHVKRLRQICDVISYKLSQRGDYEVLFKQSIQKQNQLPKK